MASPPAPPLAPSLSLLLLLSLAPSQADFSDQCPPSCDCKWANGKREADCSGAAFTAVPTHLHHEIQVRAGVAVAPAGVIRHHSINPPPSSSRSCAWAAITCGASARRSLRGRAC